jgi:hypothetical protein
VALVPFVLVVEDGVAILGVSLKVVVAGSLGHLYRSGRFAVEDGDAEEGAMAVLVEGCLHRWPPLADRYLHRWPLLLLSRVSGHRGRPAAPRNLREVLSCTRPPCRKSSMCPMHRANQKGSARRKSRQSWSVRYASRTITLISAPSSEVRSPQYLIVGQRRMEWVFSPFR